MANRLPQDSPVQARNPRVSVALAIIVAGALVFSLRSAIAAAASAPTATFKVAAPPTAMPPFFGAPERIGTSAQGRPIVAYRLGAGPI